MRGIMALLFRLKYTPINSFSVTMGLLGLSLAWQRFSLVSHIPLISHALGFLASSIFLILFLAYLYKVFFHFSAVKAEWRNPVLKNFFPAVSISLLLLSTFWRTYPLGEFFWITGTILQVLFSVFIVTQWVCEFRTVLKRINPVWYLPAVGNIIVPTSGSYFGYSLLSEVFFFVGLLFWVTLTVILLVCLVQRAILPAQLRPTYFIFLAPPSLGFISYVSMGYSDNIAISVLYGFALVTVMMLIIKQAEFTKLPFFFSSWAYSFPLAAFSVASFIMVDIYGGILWLSLSITALLVTTCIIVHLLVNTVKAYINSEIFVIENA